MLERRPQHPGAAGHLEDVSNLPECLLPSGLPSGGELGSDHPLLHSADKWAVFLRHRGEDSQSRQASASRDTEEILMTLKYESGCPAS